jgi:hypothetical protein
MMIAGRGELVAGDTITVRASCERNGFAGERIATSIVP